MIELNPYFITIDTNDPFLYVFYYRTQREITDEQIRKAAPPTTEIVSIERHIDNIFGNFWNVILVVASDHQNILPNDMWPLWIE